MRRRRDVEGRLGLVQGHAAPCAFRDDRPDQTGDCDHQDGARDLHLGEQSKVAADEDDRQRRGRSIDAQTEDQQTFVAKVPEDSPGNQGGGKFRDHRDDDHAQDEDPRLDPGDQQTDVDEHPHRQQEEGNKDRIPCEMDPRHQEALLWDQAVERQPDQEGPDDRLQAGQTGQVGTQ